MKDIVSNTLNRGEAEIILSGLVILLMLLSAGGCNPLQQHSHGEEIESPTDSIGSAIVYRPASANPSLDEPSSRSEGIPNAGETALSPTAVLPVTLHDFGVMYRGDIGNHLFEVRNEGSAPLSLKLKETSCKCTLADLPNGRIAPGESAKVKLTWESGDKLGRFAQGAILETNDPRNPYVRVKIRGTVITRLACSPEYVVFDDVGPGRKSIREVLIYSQSWASFGVPHFSSTLDALEWEVTPASAELLAEVDAKCGYVARLELKPELPVGEFRGSMEVTAHSLEDADPQSVAVPVSGRVQSAIALISPNIHSGGVLSLDKIKRGTAHREKVLVKVRDGHELQLEDIEATPDFLQVEMKPYRERGRELGLYELFVTVPDDAPVCNHGGDLQGSVRLHTNHPNKPVIEFAVDFAVIHVPRRPSF